MFLFKFMNFNKWIHLVSKRSQWSEDCNEKCRCDSWSFMFQSQDNCTNKSKQGILHHEGPFPLIKMAETKLNTLTKSYLHTLKWSHKQAWKCMWCNNDTSPDPHSCLGKKHKYSVAIQILLKCLRPGLITQTARKKLH